MVPDRLSRRDALRLSSIAVLGLAGCMLPTSGIDRQDTTTSSPTASEHEYSHQVDTPESRTMQNPEGKPAVRSSAHSPLEDTFESSAKWDYEDWLVTSSQEWDALTFSPATTGVEAATEFIANTNLSKETLLIHQYNVGSCETRKLDYLKWDTEENCGDEVCGAVKLKYEKVERENDCQDNDTDGSDGPPYSEDSHGSEATIIRLPKQIQSYGRFGYQV